MVRRRQPSDRVVPPCADTARVLVRIAVAYAPTPHVPRSHCPRARRHPRRQSVTQWGFAPRVAAPPGAPRCCWGTRSGRHVGPQAQFEGCEEAEVLGEEQRKDARCMWRVLCREEEREILRACAGGGAVKEE